MVETQIKSTENLVNHEGVVTKITDKSITISLNGNINCEGCKAKAACGVSESNDKEIEVFELDQTFSLNEPVNIVLEKQLGLKAVFWAYIFPFILMMIVLVISSSFFTEWLAGILSIIALVPYYFMLFIFNNKFKKAFKLSILKYN